MIFLDFLVVLSSLIAGQVEYLIINAKSLRDAVRGNTLRAAAAAVCTNFTGLSKCDSIRFSKLRIKKVRINLRGDDRFLTGPPELWVVCKDGLGGGLLLCAFA